MSSKVSMIVPSCPRSITPSWTVLNCLLCITTCLAAFCPNGPVPGRGIEEYGVVVGFVGRTVLSSSRHPRPSSSSFPSRRRIFALPISSGRSRGERRRRRCSTRRAGAAASDADDAIGGEDDGSSSSNNTDDDDHGTTITSSWRSKASKRVRTLRRLGARVGLERVVSLPDASRTVREVVATGATKGGSPIAGVLTDAAFRTADEVRSAALDVIQRSRNNSNLENRARIEADAQAALDAISLAKTSVADAFDAAEDALSAAETNIRRARTELEAAKGDARLGLAVAEKAAAEAAGWARRETEGVLAKQVEMMESSEDEKNADEGNEGAAIEKDEGGREMKEDEAAVELNEITLKSINAQLKVDQSTGAAEKGETELRKDVSKAVAERIESKGEEEGEENTDAPSDKWSIFDASSLSYDDVDYTLTDMAPPFIGEDECLVPGEPVVRVEKAPQNSRRIFAGIDIPVGVDEVWRLLTDYPNLQKVVPNLVVNEVLRLYPGENGKISTSIDDEKLSPAQQCQTLSNDMKGAVLKQVGGARVVGINFSARTTLEVREWPLGMPDFAHFEDEVYEGKSRSTRAKESRKRELARYVFPRPFALSSLPHKDVSMQSVEDDDGEFRMYQGVWRMQPLPGCGPPGSEAMRLTYAVEVSPRPYLPVALVEGRIAQDLCSNLKAIRDIVATRE